MPDNPVELNPRECSRDEGSLNEPPVDAQSVSASPLRDGSRRWVLALIGLGLFVILSLSLAPSRGTPWISGLAWGTLYGHFVATGFTLATQSGRLSERLSITFVWLASIVTSLFIAATVSTKQISQTSFMALSAAVIASTASACTALALTACRRLFGLQVARVTGNDAGDARRYQLSIRQLFGITTIIALVLGLGRVLVQPLLGSNIVQQEGRSIAILFLIGLASVLSQVPNWLALLLPRRWPYGLMVTLALTVAINFAEIQLIVTVPQRREPHLAWILSMINAIATAWVLAFAVAYRRAGYRIARRDSA